MKHLSLAIVGIDYPNPSGPDRRFELAICAPGETIEFRLEPKNKADPRAVAVYSCRGVQLGYLTAERAPWFGAIIRSGREIRAIYQGLHGKAAWTRVALDGLDPILPRSRPEPEPEPDFYPDWIPPDD